MNRDVEKASTSSSEKVDYQQLYSPYRSFAQHQWRGRGRWRALMYGPGTHVLALSLSISVTALSYLALDQVKALKIPGFWSALVFCLVLPMSYQLLYQRFAKGSRPGEEFDQYYCRGHLHSSWFVNYRGSCCRREAASDPLLREFHSSSM